jgi:ActR/RegA family two-component response regulator/DNA-binding transcriptional ArsR family regulator
MVHDEKIGSAMRMLIVDDDPTSRKSLEAMLTEGGHSVTAVSTAEQAKLSLEATQFEVMFTDLRVGRASGMDLLADSRSRWPRMSVVMLTDRGSRDQAVEALRKGALDYLPKPIRADQVDRVLELVAQQISLRKAGLPLRDPGEYARALSEQGAYDVLLISPTPPPKNLTGVIYVGLEPEDPVRIEDSVRSYAESRKKAAVVLAAVEELLARHQEEDIASLLESVQTLLRGKGPLAVGYDPDRITDTGALAMRASLVSPIPHDTLEALSNPLRRLILRRLAKGPCTFTQVLEAAQIDDTSKIAFHLRKLSESNLVEHVAGETYELSERGRGAITILDGIDQLDSGHGVSNRVFAYQRSAPSGRGSGPAN